MPAVRHFSELTKDFSPERRERIEQRKEQLRQEMTLAEPRKAFPLTQEHAGQEPVPRQPLGRRPTSLARNTGGSASAC